MVRSPTKTVGQSLLVTKQQSTGDFLHFKSKKKKKDTRFIHKPTTSERVKLEDIQTRGSAELDLVLLQFHVRVPGTKALVSLETPN